MERWEISNLVTESRAAIQRSRELAIRMRQTREELVTQSTILNKSAAALLYTMGTIEGGGTGSAPAVRSSLASTIPAQVPPACMDSKDTEALKSLTPREIEVLRLLGEGYRTKEIAFSLGITFKTAVTHRSNIMDKIGIHEGPRLVRFAIRTGLCAA